MHELKLSATIAERIAMVLIGKTAELILKCLLNFKQNSERLGSSQKSIYYTMELKFFSSIQEVY